MKKKYKRILWITAAVIVVAAAAVNLLQPMTVAGLKVAPASYQNAVAEEGSLFAQRKWSLFAPQSLVVKSIHVKEGDPVSAGDLLIELDDRLLAKQLTANQNALELQLLALEGELASAEAQGAQYSDRVIGETLAGISLQIDTLTGQLDAARKRYENSKILFAGGYISQTELEEDAQAVLSLENSISSLQNNLAAQRSQMTATQSYYSSLQNTLQERIAILRPLVKTGETDPQSAQIAFMADQTSLYAPQDGVVLSIAAREEELADPSRPAVTIYEAGFVGAEVFLLPADASLIKAGTAANIVIEGQNGKKESYPAVVTSVAPNAEEIASKLGLLESRVRVALSVSGEQSLIIGQKADIEFVFASREGAIAIPKTALFEYQDGFAVMVESGGKAALVPVQKDFETDTSVVLLSGLSEGDVVLLNPTQEGLKEGKGIRVDLQ